MNLLLQVLSDRKAAASALNAARRDVAGNVLPLTERGTDLEVLDTYLHLQHTEFYIKPKVWWLEKRIRRFRDKIANAIDNDETNGGYITAGTYDKLDDWKDHIRYLNELILEIKQMSN